MTRNSVKAADAFAALGIAPADWTDTMRLAVKQNWTNLPVDKKVDDLRAEIAAIKPEPVPPAEVLLAQGFGTEDECRAEVNRLKRNASVNAWRARGQLQAALDAREAKFARVRAARSGGGSATAVKKAS